MNQSTPAVSIVGLLGLLFVGLKLAGVITWPWLWVLAPFWIPAVLVILVLIISFILVVGFGMGVNKNGRP